MVQYLRLSEIASASVLSNLTDGKVGGRYYWCNEMASVELDQTSKDLEQPADEQPQKDMDDFDDDGGQSKEIRVNIKRNHVILAAVAFFLVVVVALGALLTVHTTKSEVQGLKTHISSLELMRHELEAIKRASKDGTFTLDTVKAKVQKDLANGVKADIAELDAENQDAEAKAALQKAKEKVKGAITFETKSDAKVAEVQAKLLVKEKDEKLAIAKKLQSATQEAFRTRNNLRSAMVKWKTARKGPIRTAALNEVAQARLTAREKDAKVFKADLKRVDGAARTAHQQAALLATEEVEAQHAVAVFESELADSQTKLANAKTIEQTEHAKFQTSVAERKLFVHKRSAKVAKSLMTRSNLLVEALQKLREAEARVERDLESIASPEERKKAKLSTAKERARVTGLRDMLFDSHQIKNGVMLVAMKADSKLANQRKALADASLTRAKKAKQEDPANMVAKKLVTTMENKVVVFAKLLNATQEAVVVKRQLSSAQKILHDVKGPEKKQAARKSIQSFQLQLQEATLMVRSATSTLSVEDTWQPVAESLAESGGFYGQWQTLNAGKGGKAGKGAKGAKGSQ